MSALPSGAPGPAVLVPHWLAGAQRTQLATAVRQALNSRPVHPVAVIHLEDVLTELHVAAARDAVWPASAARVSSGGSTRGTRSLLSLWSSTGG